MENDKLLSFTKGAAVSLLMFGGTIGVMTALSDAKGTVVTLLGLLFALIGGSLVSLYKKDGLTGAQREGMFRSAGWLSGGILLGLILGFLAIVVDTKWLRAPEHKDSSPSPGTTMGSRTIVIHAKMTPKMNSLREAIGAQLGAPSVSESQKTTLRRLSGVLEDADFTNAVSEAAKMIQSSANLQDMFTDQFKAVFGQPTSP